MPLTGTETTLIAALKPAIISELESFFGFVADDPVQLAKFAEAMAKAIADKIIPHITANALVTTTVTVTGVQSGVSSAGGSGTGVIS